jgi:ATP-dependent protease HslVU (ClpYQ) peptidase subunit
MTIALAVRASNGIVVAADTEISTGGTWMKGAQGKMACFFAHDEKWAGQVDSCIVAGAGDAAHLQSMIEILGNEFLGADPLLPLNTMTKGCGQTMQSAFGDCIKRFYEDHVFPFAGTREPAVEMLVACQRKTMVSIFRSERTIVNYESPFSAVGAGSMYAQWLLGKLWAGGMSVDQAEVLAAYVVYLVKDIIETCGKHTTISSIISGHQEVLKTELTSYPQKLPGLFVPRRLKIGSARLGVDGLARKGNKYSR